MGGSQSYKIPSSKWDFVWRDDRYEIYRNSQGLLAEKHLIANNPKLSQAEQQEAYYYRYATNKPLVKVYRAQYDTTDDLCSPHKNIQVFTQYIPYRLSETKNLTHEQALYVLSQSLIGFYDLYQRLGAFPVDDTLIGFNQDGKVRVWHSPNYAKNHFENDNIVLMSTQNLHNFDQRLVEHQQKEMIADIWFAVEEHSLMNLSLARVPEEIKDFRFNAAKALLDKEIQKNGNVPASLRFQDKNGIIGRSKVNNFGQQSQHSGVYRSRYSNKQLQYRPNQV